MYAFVFHLSRHGARPIFVFLPAFLVVLLIALGMAAGLWYQQRLRDETRTSLAGQVQSSASAANQAVEQAQQALSLAQEQSQKIAALESSLRESQSQADSLEQAFQTLTDSGSDLVLINDIDHLVTIAQQQLRSEEHTSELQSLMRISYAVFG